MNRIRQFLLLAALAVALLVDLYLPHPRAYLADPVTTSILVSLAISAAVTAAETGLQYLAASKRKVPPVDRGRLDDVRVSTAGYNENIVKIWGKSRMAPVWIWHTPIAHTTVTTPGQSGGKGPPRPPTPTTVDHIYSTSLAGVVHDGLLYNNITRIWFNADLVYNGNLSSNSAIYREAEYATLAGGASVVACSTCSNGKRVTGLGNGGTATFYANMASAGDYEINIAYLSTSDLTFKLSANGGASQDVVCTSSGGLTIVAFQTATVTLLQGANTILFANAAAACPDIDVIQIAPKLAFTSAGADARAFTGLINLNKVAPPDQNKFWAFQNERLIDLNGGGGGGGGGAGAGYSATLAKWGSPTIRLYPGSRVQTPDSSIVANKGTGNVPAYRDFAYMLIDGLQLPNGQLPNVTVEADQGTRDLPTIVTEIYALVGIGSSKLDLSQLNGLILGDTTGFSAGTYSAITWIGLVNCTQTGGGAITKTSGGNGWTAYANSGDTISAGTDAAIRFTAAAGVFMIGFATTTTPGSASPHPYDQVPFAVLLNVNSVPSQAAKNAVQMSLGGSANSADVGTWSVGDKFQVELRDGTFSAYQNGLLLTGFAAGVPTYPVYPIFVGYKPVGGADGGGVSAATFATGSNIGTKPTVTNAGALVVANRKRASEALADLQTRFQFDMVNIDGKEKAILRNKSASDITIPYADLRAHLAGSEMPAFDAGIDDIDSMLLPQRVDVNYLDPQLDYHTNVQSDMVLSGPQQDIQNLSLSLVESADNIKSLATALLNKAHIESRMFKFQTGPKYMHIHPGTIATLQLPNATHTVRVTRCSYQLPAGVCEFEAVRHAPSLYSPTATGSVSTGFQAPIVSISGNTKGVIIDGPILRPEDAGDGTQPVVYVAACHRGAGKWDGGFFYQETPIASGSYGLITFFDKQAGIGVTSGVLASVSDPSIWDRTSSLTINFYPTLTLSSATEQNLLANPTLNLLAIVNPSTNAVEYVQFKTAAAGSASAPYHSNYSVSGFLRGRMGTDGNVGVHTSADDVVVMDSTVKPRRMALADVGRSLKFKFVSSGQSVDDAIVVSQVINGTALLPLAPANVTGSRSADGLLIGWRRRSRIAPGMISNSDVPVAEAVEEYNLKVLNSALVVIRTHRVLTGVSQPAILVGVTQSSYVSGNNINEPASGTVLAYIDQLLRQNGDSVETTLNLTALDPAIAGILFNLTDDVQGTKIGSTKGNIFQLTFSPLNTTTSRIEIYENGVFGYGANIGQVQQTRIKAIVRSAQVEWYRDGALLPFYISTKALRLPVLGTFTVNVGNTVKDVRISSLQPSFFYTSAQQVADFGESTQARRVRVSQVSAIVGEGPYTEAVI